MNKNPIIKYLTQITIFSICICFGIMLLWLTPIRNILANAPYYILMFYIVTLGFWIFLYYAKNNNKLKFEQAYMISKIGKLLIYILVFVIILLVGLEKNIKFAFVFLGLYLAYLIFDIITLMKLIRNNKQDNNK